MKCLVFFANGYIAWANVVTTVISQDLLKSSLVPRLLGVGGEKRAWYTLFAHAPSSLGNQSIVSGSHVP